MENSEAKIKQEIHKSIIGRKEQKSLHNRGPRLPPIRVILGTHSEVWAFLFLKEAMERV